MVVASVDRAQGLLQGSLSAVLLTRSSRAKASLERSEEILAQREQLAEARWPLRCIRRWCLEPGFLIGEGLLALCLLSLIHVDSRQKVNIGEPYLLVLWLHVGKGLGFCLCFFFFLAELVEGLMLSARQSCKCVSVSLSSFPREWQCVSCPAAAFFACALLI